MKNIISTTIRYFLTGSLMLFVFSMVGYAQAFSTANSTPAGIQSVVDDFRAALGTNNGVGGSFKTGRREINWDGVPNDKAAPNTMPADFFNTTSARGVVLSSIGSSRFQVSANQSSGTAPRFGNVATNYSTSFQTFSQQRLFTAVSPPVLTANSIHRVVEVRFFVPGTNIPATVNAFGAVFCDVDSIAGTGNIFNGSTSVAFYRADGSLIESRAVQAFNNGLSFLGVKFDDERVARVVIISGNSNFGEGNADGGVDNDVVVMDDFIYGEPRAQEFHANDFDGDGTTDLSVFRPATGQWFVLNSGSNTFTAEFFGSNGDRPIDGDFDGDSLADRTVFRPSTGTWFSQSSKTGGFVTTAFGTSGDKPVAGDYDKDGKTDIAVWRPSDGNYYIQKSSDSTFSIQHWGANGDIPIGTAAQ